MLTAAAMFVVSLALPPGAACVVGIPLEVLEPEHGIVFEGTVTYIPGEVVIESIAMPRATVEVKGLRVWFDVEQAWKGEPGTGVEIVYTHHAQQIHGRFRHGDRFIVWAYKRHGRWMTSDCSPTVERARAGVELLTFLERLRK